MKPLAPQQIMRLQQMATAASQARQAGQWSVAEGLYHDILKQAPHAWDIHQQLGMLLAGTGRALEAAKCFRLIVKANPTHAASHANLASALAEAGALEEAIAEFGRALALEPKLLGARIVLATTLFQAKLPEQAILHFKTALNADPANPVVFNGLGLAYRAMDDLPRALECLEKAVALAPQYVEYRINFGVTLIRGEFYQLAIAQFIEAERIQPSSLEALVFLSEALQQQNRYDEARGCLERAMQHHPQELELYERRGSLYQLLGDVERALTDFLYVLAQSSQRALALAGVGGCYIEKGLHEAAGKTIQDLIRYHPEFEVGYFQLASSRKFKSDDPLIAQLQALADKKGTADKTATVLNFALGKIYDDCQQWELAFKYYAIGNQLANLVCDYQAELVEADIDRVIQVFSREFIAWHSELQVQSSLPVLIVGMPRSGTTLTEQIISSHPQVIGAGEVSFWNEMPVLISNMLGSRADYLECLSLITPEMAHDVASQYLDLLQKIAGVDTSPTHIIDKMPQNFMHLGLIALLFPNAPIIHCKRDAMDNCLSIFFQYFNFKHAYAFDLANLGHYHKQYERLMAHWHAVLPGRIFDINYEDTIADPEYWSRQLIQHVGLQWDDACLAPHKQERNVKTASHFQVRQPIYKTSVARWKNYEQYLGPLAEVLGR